MSDINTIKSTKLDILKNNIVIRTEVLRPMYSGTNIKVTHQDRKPVSIIYDFSINSIYQHIKALELFIKNNPDLKGKYIPCIIDGYDRLIFWIKVDLRIAIKADIDKIIWIDQIRK